jgi:RND superfamily putative drug exporter
VAGVVGPEDQLLASRLSSRRGPFLSRDGTAARYLVILSTDPLQAPAIATVSRLRADLPRLLTSAGLPGARTSIGGDTAVAEHIVDRTVHDLGRIAAVALAVNLLILVLFLRAAVAPLCLLASSVLAVAASLGLTTWLFRNVPGTEGFTFYAPFVAAVLLVALGSDYNVFAVGHAWAEARRRPFREALATTLPQSARTIRTAGFTLAVSFGLLALVPLHPFIVRSLVVPAALTLIGPPRGWPSRRPATRRPDRLTVGGGPPSRADQPAVVHHRRRLPDILPHDRR